MLEEAVLPLCLVQSNPCVSPTACNQPQLLLSKLQLKAPPTCRENNKCYYYTSVIIFYIKINSIVLLFFQAYVEKFTSPVNSFQLFDRHLQTSKVRDLKLLCLSQLRDLKDRIIKVRI